MIILHFDLPPQFTYELFHIRFTTLLIVIPNLQPYHICDFQKQTSRTHFLAFQDGEKEKFQLNPYIQIYENKDLLFLKFCKQVSLNVVSELNS